MWVNNEQRDRIFEMIGTRTGTVHRAPGVRSDHRALTVVAATAGVLALWLILSSL